MKFAHIADCHVGGWREPKLRDSSAEAFDRAIDKCIEEKIDFLLVSGDLFNNAVPPLDALRCVVRKLKQLKDLEIPVYIIAGSHDFSPSGKTMLQVLESAGLAVNAAKGHDDGSRVFLEFTVDKKTGAKIAGMVGRKGGLEKSYYEALERSSLENEKGYKIFMFHSALTELKPADMEKMDSAPVSLLPKNFDYYAGGHVHIVSHSSLEGYKSIVFPGPLFPNSFSEIEKLQSGGFYIVEDGIPRYEPVAVHPAASIIADCAGKSPEDAEQMIEIEMKNREFLDAIVTLRVSGQLRTGRPSDINFKRIIKEFYDKGAYVVMKNTNKLSSREFEEVVSGKGSVEEIEESLITENTGKSGAFSHSEEAKIVRELMAAFADEKLEGESSAEFEKRIRENASKITGI